MKTLTHLGKLNQGELMREFAKLSDQAYAMEREDMNKWISANPEERKNLKPNPKLAELEAQMKPIAELIN